ncbi:MAG: helix-turn-helix domain-containing protein [Variibacter sp.]
MPQKPRNKARSQATKPHVGRADNRLEAALGQVVREFRQRASLSVTQLAKLAGLSPGMMSKIENGAISPSLASIRALSSALQVPVTTLFREFDEVSDATFVRGGEGTKVSRSGQSLLHEYFVLGQTTARGITVEPFLMTYDKRSKILPFLHRDGTQFIYLLEGKMIYRHGQKTYQMSAGDSLLFQANVPHGPEQLLVNPVRYLSVISYLGGVGG